MSFRKNEFSSGDPAAAFFFYTDQAPGLTYFSSYGGGPLWGGVSLPTKLFFFPAPKKNVVASHQKLWAAFFPPSFVPPAPWGFPPCVSLPPTRVFKRRPFPAVFCASPPPKGVGPPKIRSRVIGPPFLAPRAQRVFPARQTRAQVPINPKFRFKRENYPRQIPKGAPRKPPNGGTPKLPPVPENGQTPKKVSPNFGPLGPNWTLVPKKGAPGLPQPQTWRPFAPQTPPPLEPEFPNRGYGSPS